MFESAFAGDAGGAAESATGSRVSNAARRTARGVMVAAMLAVGAVMFVPAPAQAGGDYIQVCLPDEDDDDLFVQCFWILVYKLDRGDLWPDPDVCPQCWPALDIFKDDVDPVVRGEFNEYFGKGFGYLAEAALTEDVKLAERLRADAVQLFLAAAEVVGKYEVALDRTGWLDLDSGKFYGEPDPEPMVQIGKEIVEAFGLLDKALGDPDPQPSIEAALGHLDAAVAQLNKLAVS